MTDVKGQGDVAQLRLMISVANDGGNLSGEVFVANLRRIADRLEALEEWRGKAYKLLDAFASSPCCCGRPELKDEMCYPCRIRVLLADAPKGGGR